MPQETLKMELVLSRYKDAMYWGVQNAMSDSLGGFASNQVECIRMLSGLKDPSSCKLSRLTVGNDAASLQGVLSDLL